jgi:glycosyltransferase involved in cell wall biosynthesis
MVNGICRERSMSEQDLSSENIDNEVIEISDPSRLTREPLVSVIMLAYRHGPYLAQAIEGVVMQKAEFGIELVIGEDCSPDNTMEVALRYQRDYPDMVRIITSPKNVGMIKNLQRVMDASRGQFLAFCEGDDYWIDEEKIRWQAALLQKEVGIDLSFHSCYSLRDASRKPAGPFVAGSRDKIFTAEDVIRSGGGFIPTASIMVRKNSLSKIPKEIFEYAPVGDYIIQVYGALRGGAIYTNKAMCVYRMQHPESWSSSLSKIEKIKEFENSFNKLLQEMDADIGQYKESFTKLIYRSNLTELVRSQYRREHPKAKIYYDLLIANSSRLSPTQRLIVHCCRNRSLFCLMVKVCQKVGRKFMDIAAYPFNSMNSMHSKNSTSG